MYLPPSGFDKLDRGMSKAFDIQQWDNEEVESSSRKTKYYSPAISKPTETPTFYTTPIHRFLFLNAFIDLRHRGLAKTC